MKISAAALDRNTTNAIVRSGFRYAILARATGPGPDPNRIARIGNGVGDGNGQGRSAHPARQDLQRQLRQEATASGKEKVGRVQAAGSPFAGGLGRADERGGVPARRRRKRGSDGQDRTEGG